MNFKHVLDIVELSDTFKRFKEEYPHASLCAGFFILDFFGNDTKQSVDYKTNDNIFTFEVLPSHEIVMVKDPLLDDSKKHSLHSIERMVEIEVEELKEIVEVACLENKLGAKLTKIIAILLRKNGSMVWDLTCMLEGLIVLHVIVNAHDGSLLSFERKSMMDLVKKK